MLTVGKQLNGLSCYTYQCAPMEPIQVFNLKFGIAIKIWIWLNNISLNLKIEINIKV